MSNLRESWLKENLENSDFTLWNIPFGIASQGDKYGPVSRVGNTVFFLSDLYGEGLFTSSPSLESALDSPILNDFIELGKSITREVREKIQQAFVLENKEAWEQKIAKYLISVKDVEMHMPLSIGDYTDFYSSIEHATNVGKMFRDPENALLPNWKHIPVGYHGRASSIVVSGTDILRPQGQRVAPEGPPPSFGPSNLLDFELEMGFVVGKNTELGETIPVDQAEEHIFGMMLFNDWSARDIQKWEYVPLGPFLGKSFASTISPWIVCLEALDPFRVPSPAQNPEPLPYLLQKNRSSFDLNLSAFIKTEDGTENKITETNFKYMYWTQAQQLAHHASNGCNFNVGDVCASGTISGKDKDSYGSMLELTWRGTQPLTMKDGTERKFLKDGDTLILRGYGEKGGIRVGFGEATGKILPAK